MHFTTSTRISARTQTHTEGCLQYASKPPSQLANAKFLPNKYRNKCINTCLMRCRRFLCISDWIPPTSTPSLIVNEPKRQVSNSNPAHSLPTAPWVLILYNPHLIFLCFASVFSLRVFYYPPCTLFPPGQIPPPVHNPTGSALLDVAALADGGAGKGGDVTGMSFEMVRSSVYSAEWIKSEPQGDAQGDVEVEGRGSWLLFGRERLTHTIVTLNCAE